MASTPAALLGRLLALRAVVVALMATAAFGQASERVYAQEDPADGRTVENVVYREQPTGVEVFVVLADGSVAAWPPAAAASRFGAELSDAALIASAYQGRLIESPHSREIGFLRYPGPEDPSAAFRFSVLGAAAKEIAVPRFERTAFQVADGAPIVAVLRAVPGSLADMRFEIHGRTELPVVGPAMPIDSVRLSADGARVVAVRRRALTLFDAADAEAALGEQRTALGGYAISADGERVAALMLDSVDVHDARGLMRSFAVDGVPIAAGFGPNGELAVIDLHTLYLFPAGAGGPLWRRDLTPDERARGVEYRSVAVRAFPPAVPGGNPSLVVAAGRLAVTRKPMRGNLIGSAEASVVAYRADGAPAGAGPVIGTFHSAHFGNRSPRVELLFAAGRAFVAARSRDAVLLWRVEP